MKKISYLIILLLITQYSFAQEKLKGNKNVVTQHRDIPAFTAILIKDNLKVNITESPNAKVSVETDENLQLAVETRVIDEVLEIYLSQPIKSKKKLNIYLGVTDSIQKIELRDNASLSGENEIHCTDLTIITQDNSNIKAKFRLENLIATIDDRSDANLVVSAKDNIIVAMDHNASLKLNTSCKELSVNLSKATLIKATGNCKELKIISEDNGSFKGKELNADHVSVLVSDRTDTYIKASKKVVINAENNAEIYIYDAPEIIIEKLTDKTTIFKK